jgi:hypothetical protein
MIDYALILRRRYPRMRWILNGEEYTGLDWFSDTEKPSKATLDSMWVSVQQEVVDEETARQAVYTKLGLTADEVKALLS